MSSWTKTPPGSILRTLGAGDSSSLDAAGENRLVAALTTHADVFLFVYAPQAKTLLSWSANAPRVLGVKDVAIARDGNLFLRHVHPDDRFLLFSDLERALDGQTDYRATYRWIRPDTNEVRWLHCRGGLVQREGEALFEGLIIDLSAEFTGTVGMLAGPDSVATVLAAFPTTVFTVDRDLRLLRVNRRLEDDQPSPGIAALFRSDRFAVGKSLLDAFSDPAEHVRCAEIFRRILDGDLPRHQTRLSQGDHVTNLEIVPLIEHERIDGLLFVCSDVSATVSLERRLADLQRAEGLRTLAAGVVHNFNNALQRIIGQAAVLKNHADQPAVIEQAGQTIIDIVTRASELTRQLFVYDEAAATTPVPLDLNVAAMAAINRIKDLFSTGLKVSVAFGSVGTILGRSEPLVDSLEALIRLIRDGAPAGGALIIKTFETAHTPQPSGSGTHVRFVVSESVAPSSDGESLPDAAAAALPAFAAAAGELHEMKGAVTVVRDPFGRRTITAAFPLSAAETAPLREAAAARAPAHEPAILIIDDDVMVLETVRALLSDLGFRTIATPDPANALDLVAAHSASLELVLLDALMPGMDGTTLLKRLKRRAPDLKVIGFSGAPHHVTEGLLRAGACQILRKPVDPTTLREAIQGALRSRKAA